MDNTKRNNKRLRHYELTTRMDMRDMMNFSFFVIDNEYYKFKRGKYILLRILTALILYPMILEIIVAAEFIFNSGLLRIILSIVFGFGLVFVITSIKSPYPRFSGKKAAIAIVESTCGCRYKEAREVFFNLGEKGFSTNAIDYLDTVFFEYNAFARIIECKHGIIMIRSSMKIICIPAKCMDDEAACFLVEKLSKKCRKRFISVGKMKIGADENPKNPTERNEHK